MWRTSRKYPCDSSSPAEARRFCTRNLEQMLADHLGAESVIADAEVIVSELLSNAINARCNCTELMLSAREGCVRIEVHDDAAGVPELRHPDVAEIHGRGLLIVSALATDWGVETSARGKRVWAELALI